MSRTLLTGGMVAKKTLLFILFVVAVFYLSACAPLEQRLCSKGKESYKNKQYSEAIAYYHKALEKNAHYYKAFFGLGVVYANMQEYQKAAEYFEKALVLKPQAETIRFNLAASYYNLKKYREAYKLVYESDYTDSVELINKLGYRLAEQNQDIIKNSSMNNKEAIKQKLLAALPEINTETLAVAYHIDEHGKILDIHPLKGLLPEQFEKVKPIFQEAHFSSKMDMIVEQYFPDIIIFDFKDSTENLKDKKRKRADIENTVKKDIDIVKSCYKKEINAEIQEQEEGRLVYGFIIDPSGKVVYNRILVQHLGLMNMINCTADYINSRKFLPSEDWSVVDYIFAFRILEEPE